MMPHCLSFTKNPQNFISNFRQFISACQFLSKVFSSIVCKSSEGASNFNWSAECSVITQNMFGTVSKPLLQICSSNVCFKQHSKEMFVIVLLVFIYFDCLAEIIGLTFVLIFCMFLHVSCRMSLFRLVSMSCQ